MPKRIPGTLRASYTVTQANANYTAVSITGSGTLMGIHFQGGAVSSGGCIVVIDGQVANADAALAGNKCTVYFPASGFFMPLNKEFNSSLVILCASQSEADQMHAFYKLN